MLLLLVPNENKLSRLPVVSVLAFDGDGLYVGGRMGIMLDRLDSGVALRLGWLPPAILLWPVRMRAFLLLLPESDMDRAG